RQKHAEHVGAADHAELAVRQAQRVPRLIERSAARIPQHRGRVRGIGRNARDRPRQDDAPAQVRMRLMLMRIAPMHDRVDAVEPVLEEALVRLEAQLIRHHARGIREHAVFGHDGVALDAGRKAHERDAGSGQCMRAQDYPAMLKNSCRVAGLSRKQPNMRLVTRSEPGLCTPRVVMQWCEALMMTPTPCGFSTSLMVLAICAVSFSWICSRLA